MIIYKIIKDIETKNESILKVDEKGIVWGLPKDPDNTDYQQYLAWVEAGNTPEPADIPPVVIPDISMRQARLALLADGLLDDVESALSTPEYKIWWEYSTVVERNNYLVNDVLKILGKSDEEIDQMFIGASQL